LRKAVAEKAITVLALQEEMLPLKSCVPNKGKAKTKSGILYIAAGADGKNELAGRLRASLNARVMALPYSDTEAINTFNTDALKKYKKIIISLHGIGRYPAKNFGLPMAVINLINKIQAENKNALLLTFGNPYVNKYFVESRNLVACYEDDAIFQGAAADWLLGKYEAVGTLPVTVGTFRYGSGIIKKKTLK
jgi:hypothetical protein